MSLDLSAAVQVAENHVSDLAIVNATIRAAVRASAPALLRLAANDIENWADEYTDGSSWDAGVDATLSRLRQIADELEAGR